MKLKRRKHCNKYLSFYQNKFKIHQPYQLIIDLTFCQAALQNRVQIKEQLKQYLDGEINLFVTSCTLAEGKELGTMVHGAMVVAENFEIRKCNHEKPVTAVQCISSLMKKGNKHGLFIATQDPELRDKLRKIPGVPLLHVNHNVIVLEKPSAASVSASECEESKRLISKHEQEVLKQLKKTEEPVRVKRKRKGPKEPNPLSVKKKKKIDVSAVKAGDDVTKKKRRRRKKRNANGGEA